MCPQEKKKIWELAKTIKCSESENEKILIASRTVHGRPQKDYMTTKIVHRKPKMLTNGL